MTQPGQADPDMYGDCPGHGELDRRFRTCGDCPGHGGFGQAAASKCRSAQKSASEAPVSALAVVVQALPAGSSAAADGVHVRVTALMARELPPPVWAPSVTVTVAPLIVIVALNVALPEL